MPEQSEYFQNSDRLFTGPLLENFLLGKRKAHIHLICFKKQQDLYKISVQKVESKIRQIEQCSKSSCPLGIA